MAGSGTTGIAAKELGRNFLLNDANFDYCEVMQKRFLERFEEFVEIQYL